MPEQRDPARPAAPGAAASAASNAASAVPAGPAFQRVRPPDDDWPEPTEWFRLDRAVGGRLIKLEPPFEHCAEAPQACAARKAALRNPFAVGDDPALTQTSGWLDAWASETSVYAVAAQKTADVVAAVDFARRRRVRLVVKGGGHSYLGTSDCADSLLVWTRHMNSVELHDAFVPQGSPLAPQPAVSLGAGAMWSDAYDAVTTRGGRYVQGGGCTSVGVAGLVQSGGFGSFSKAYGTAASHLLEAEIVTADGRVRVVNAMQEPELFWALKGGGGGSLGIVTRVTLRTHALPETFGGLFGRVEANSDAAYRSLIARVVAFCADALINPHWGEQIKFEGERQVGLSLVFQGFGKDQALATWAPFIDWVKAQPGLRWREPLQALALPAQHFWDADFMAKHAPPGVMVPDARPGAPAHHAAWGGDLGQVGWFIHGYHSAWLPRSLLAPEQQAALADAIYDCKRHWDVALHLNKGLAGASEPVLAAARNTATNPQVLDAFALAIIAGGGDPAYPGLAEPDTAAARRRAGVMRQAMAALKRVAPDAGAYVSESDFFLADWQGAYWGEHYGRLLATKNRYDPDGLFYVHHGVGTEAWSQDGFVREV
ncbi:MAG: FAD-binding oxidoreductase [Paucibacter sp.]|nr:FAD-binding oxidoreductase [Roseateles sp.]